MLRDSLRRFETIILIPGSGKLGFRLDRLEYGTGNNFGTV